MSIEKGRHRDEWFITFWLPEKTDDGKRVRAPKKLVRGKKSEAKDALARYRIDYLAQLDAERERDAHAGDQTVAGYAREYHEGKVMASPLAYKRERLEIDHICRLFAGIKLNELDAKAIRKAYADERKLRESGRGLPKGGRPLSEDGLHKVHVKLRQILEQAYRDGDIDRNPCTQVSFPKPAQKEERRPLGLEDARRLRSCILSDYEDDPDPKLVALLIAMGTGARRGELLGLSWGDVDFKAGTVFVRHQFSSDKQLRDAKMGSRRTLAIDDKLLGVLKEWKRLQEGEIPRINALRQDKHLAPVSQDDDYPIVNGRLGGRLDPNNFDRFFRNWFVDHGFGRFTKDVVTKTYGGRTFTRGKGYEGLKIHELRHTVASLLIADGLDVKSAQHQLGHSSAQTTLNIYAHAFESRSHETAERLERLYR